MPTIAFISPKGGVGKTTATVVLATQLGRKAPVIVIDADPNRPVAAWAKLGRCPEKISVVSDATQENILEKIDEAAQAAPFVVVDCEGTASLTVAYAIGRRRPRHCSDPGLPAGRQGSGAGALPGEEPGAPGAPQNSSRGPSDPHKPDHTAKDPGARPGGAGAPRGWRCLRPSSMSGRRSGRCSRSEAGWRTSRRAMSPISTRPSRTPATSRPKWWSCSVRVRTRSG